MMVDQFHDYADPVAGDIFSVRATIEHQLSS